MYFNRKNSQQKNWRMIKKGKHFLFGCALVFTLGATANVASAETIVSEVTTVDQAQDSTAASEDADSEAAASTTAVSEVASSTTATSEAASETVSTSTVASSEASETTSTASEVAVSESSEASTVASSEASETSTSSETATSTSVETVSEVSSTVSASETAAANRTAFIGYEVQYTTSSGEVVGKTANIVAADTTEAVATSTLTVAATDVPAGYELAAEQAYSLTQQISENQINILSFAVVKKSEEEEIAESQLANKTVLEQVLSEATLLSEEALRLVATTQAGNTTLEAAATATQETADKATLVFEDAAATQEQVDSQVEAVKASTLALADEMLKVDEDGNLTVALSTISTSTDGLVPSNYVTTSYEVKDGYVYWTHILNSGFVNKDNYSYSFTLPKAVGSMEDLVMQRIDRNNNVVETKTTWTNNSGDEGSNGMQFIKNINEGSAGALIFGRQNQIQAAIDRTGFAGSKEILDNSQTNYYGIKTDSNVNNNYKYKVTFRTPIVDENLPLDYIVTGNPATKVQGSNVVVGQYNTQINESPEVSTIGSDGTQLYPDRSTNKYLFVFGTTEGTTETETGATSTAPGFNKDNAAVVTTMTDADGINSISYDDASIVENPQTSLGSNLILGTDGKLEGTFDHTAGGFYSRRAIVTDNAGSTTKSNVFFTYAYTDKETDTTPVEKTNGSTVTETEIYSKLAIATTSDAYQNTDYNVPTVPETEYARSIVGYRTVGSTDVTEATVDTLPTTGEYEVRVKTTNIYGQEIYNWVTVNYAEPANQAPTVTVNSTATNVPIGDGSVPNAIFVFGTNQGTTEDINGATGTSPVADPTKATQKVAEMADADGTISSIVYNDLKNDRFDLASSTDPDVNNPNDALLVNTDGYLTGHLIYGPGAKSTRRLDVTDNSGVTTNSNTFMVLGYTDKVADTTPVAKVNGIQPTEAEILAKLDIDVNSAYPNAVPSDLEIPTSQYTREIVGYRLVGSTDTVASDAAGLPTTGDYDVRVKTTNIYGQEIFNWVRVDHDDNQLPTVTVNSTPTNVQINDGSVPNAIFVFGTNQGTTEDINGATGTSPVADPTKATQKVAEIADADGTISSIVYNDLKNDRFDLASSTDPDVNNPNDALLVNTDGYLTGHLIYGPGAKSTRRLDVTDNSGVTTNSNTFMVLGYTDKVADATAIAKEEGVNVTADEIYSKLAIDVNSSYPNAVPSTLVIPEDQYTREIVGYRTVSTSGTTVTKGATTAATASTLPTSGTYEVRVKTTNIYGQEIYNWVTVEYTDTTAPEAPTVKANDDGSVTVTPSQTAGDDTKTVAFNYTDEAGATQTVTATKADDGTWSVPADSGVTIDATTGAVTIPADKVQDGSTVSATSTDEAGNTSNPATDTAKNNPDTTAPAAPAIETDLTGKAGTTDPIKVTGAEPGSTVTLKDPAGNVIGTGTANDNGEVEITPTTPLPEGSITATSTDKAGNESDPSAPKEATPADKTAPAAPAIETDLTGKAGTTDPIKVTGAEPGSTVTLKDPAGNVIGTGT
ncbi:Ig-like domain-containing protein, partial [Streptococcus suis]